MGEDSDWIHVCSKYLTAQKEDYPNVEHRLYLDTESLDTYKMAEFFVEKCEQHKLPYYFKFDELANRDDTIVIYSSTENLTKYVEILNAMAGNENTELTEWSRKTTKPPVGGFATVISEILAQGNIEQAKNFIDRVCYYEKEYSLAKHMNNRKEQTDFEQHLVTTQKKLSNKTGNIRITKVNLHKMKESLTTTKSEQRMNGTKK